MGVPLINPVVGLIDKPGGSVVTVYRETAPVTVGDKVGMAVPSVKTHGV